MTVWVSLVFCWGLGAATCQVVVPEQQRAVSLAYCAIEGQQLAASWLNTHAKDWRLDRVRCSPGSKPENQDEI